MWQLITQTLTEMPPQPTRLGSSGTPGSAEDPVPWTYGGMLQNKEFDMYDKQLKFLVMWCLGKISSPGETELEIHCRGPSGRVEFDRRLIIHKWTSPHSDLP